MIIYKLPFPRLKWAFLRTCPSMMCLCFLSFPPYSFRNDLMHGHWPMSELELCCTNLIDLRSFFFPRLVLVLEDTISSFLCISVCY